MRILVLGIGNTLLSDEGAGVAAMARLAGDWPARRCLVAVRPEKVGVGDALTPVVAAVLPAMVGAAETRIAAWRGAGM